jgi:hypothetical protein
MKYSKSFEITLQSSFEIFLFPVFTEETEKLFKNLSKFGEDNLL